ncbi:hypothetical protein HDV05_007793, partial [Chytridiales sp. JEL 0842]
SAQALDYSLAIHPSEKSFLAKDLHLSPQRRPYIETHYTSPTRKSVSSPTRSPQKPTNATGILRHSNAAATGTPTPAQPSNSGNGYATSLLKPSDSISNTSRSMNASGETVTPSSVRQQKQEPQQTPSEQIHVDASTLYKQIRATLTSEEFEEFAANVARFNASEQTADETVRRIAGLVRDGKLMMQMRNLIYTALEESVRATAGGPS